MKSSIKYGGTLRQCDLFSCRYKNVWDIRYPRVSKLLIFFVKLLFETCRYLKRSYTYKKINNVLPSRHLINLLTMFRTHTLNLFYILSLLNQYLTLCVFNFKSVLKIQQRDMRHFIYIALITITYDGAKKKNLASCRRVWNRREGGRNLSQSHRALLSTQSERRLGKRKLNYPFDCQPFKA